MKARPQRSLREVFSDCSWNSSDIQFRKIFGLYGLNILISIDRFSQVALRHLLN